MRSICILFIIIISAHFLYGQTNNSYITIKGNIKDSDGSLIYFINQGNIGLPGQSYPILDSTISINNKFSVKIPLKEAKEISINIKNSEKRCVFLGIPNSEYEIIGDTTTIYKSKISGNKEYKDYLKLVEDFKNSDSSEIIKISKNYIKKYNASTSFIYALNGIHRKYPKEFILNLTSDLSDNIKATEKYISLFSYFNPPFNNWNNEIPRTDYYTINNKKFEWENLKDKYTVLSFWASYCGPCLQNIPKYKTFINNNDINFVSLSLDNDSEYWLRTINKTSYPGIHINDFKSFEGILLQYFNVQSIPQMYLLDKNLKVIKTDGTLEDIQKTLDFLN
ncbi:TlpA disulfide reductase family protein [Sphingobacterium cavernae]|uniref:TlpA disulfide reductase family protein n=1 Tax=Sphingobacterium cavernae TaxID=2592657 RepID=UPI00123000ED|nr:TlpA disulfide reductase family protein [Sphingobacterium cavernae]